MFIMLDSMYETVSLSTGLCPNLDLWNANKLHYITHVNLCLGLEDSFFH